MTTGRPVSGRTLNGIYRVDSFIARGGMGDVYAGVNIETGGRVAIKIVAPNLASDPKMLAKVRAEARLLTLVVHPAVVPYRVIARDPELNAHYIVMDFVDGNTLSAHIRDRHADASDLLGLLRRLAGGLAAIHAVGAIHCDVSPDNVLLPGGRVDLACIVDLGIAKSLDPGNTTVVIEGFAGKIGYAAPEQLGVGNWSIGPWTDIYALALVVLCFASGAPVDMGASFAEAIERRRRVPPLDNLPPSLRGVLRDMLAPNPRDRLRSMDAVLMALDGVEAAGAGQGPIGAAARRKPRPQSRRGALSSLLTVLLGGALATESTWTARSAPNAEAIIAPRHAGERALAQASGPSLQARRGGRAADNPVLRNAFVAPPARHDPPAVEAEAIIAQDHAGERTLAHASGPPSRARRNRRPADDPVLNSTSSSLQARYDPPAAVVVAHGTTWLRQATSSVSRREPGALVVRTDTAAYGPASLICRRYVAPSWRMVGMMSASDCARRGLGKTKAGYVQIADRIFLKYQGRLFAVAPSPGRVPSAVTRAHVDLATAAAPRPAHSGWPAAFASSAAVVCRRYDGMAWKKVGSMNIRRCAEQAFALPGTGFVQSGNIVLSRRADRIGVLRAADWQPVAEVRDHATSPSSVSLSEL